MPPIYQNLYSQSNVQLDKQLDYWKQQLINASLVLELPTDKPRPLAQTYKVEKQSFILPSSLLQALYALSQQEGVTILSTLLSAFQTLLYRYSRQEDILVGCPASADDGHLTVEKANTLVLRTNMSGNPTFRDLLQKVHSIVLEAKANQDVPFEKLVEELQIERSLAYHPLFQVMFILHNTPGQTLELPGLTVTSVEVDNLASQFDLTLSIEATEQGLRGVWEYSTDLFNAATITRITGHFQTLLEQIVANPIQQIDTLPLLSATERQQLLVEWNNTHKDYPQHCVHQFFEEQVTKTPDAVAVVFEDQQLTYQQLDRRANQLAHYLRTLGVEPDVLVGICVERSLEMVIGLLGILKAGGAYVPLDPEYPKERLAFIVSDTNTPVMLTQERLVNNLPELAAQIVCLDSHWDTIAQHSTEQPVSGVTVENLMYIIYTSGSTGTPKGVMISHQGICNALYWRQETFQLTPQDKILQTISLSFDPSVWQVFWPLSFGGQLIVARPGGHRDAAYFVKETIERQITVLGLVPSIIQALLEEKGFENCQTLRHVTTGGEALSIELLERFFAGLNLDNVLINCYGPTEASIDVTTWVCQRGTDATTAPIGRPIANVQVYILDRNLQAVPLGHSGELYIGGIGVARGYLNRPELTQEKFIPNPFSDKPDARLYKTGDLVRYLPDGNIEFLGRIDDQVKVRGFRIELGEIEATLNTHPGLQQSLVMVREDIPGKKGLVAYFVAQPEQIVPSPSELRRFLQEKLPDYMIPAAFVKLVAMPLNPNGKVDRRALPAPDASDLIDANNFVAPRTPTEETLATIWMQVLGLERIGIHDNFFELGGHSLLATQVISRSRQTFDAEISVQQLFKTPTVAGLASAITTHQNQGINEHQEIARRANQGSAPLSYVQQQLWFLAQLQPDSAAYNTVTTMQLQGDLNVEVLQKSLDAIVVRHEALRTTFVAEDGNPIQVIGTPRSVELKIIDLKDCPSSTRPTLAQQQLENEAQRPFNLESDLMLRGCLLELSPQEHILMLVMHHIATDGWSMGILFEQLTSLYTAFANNLPNPLPELPIQFADYAVWQRQWLEGEVLEKQLSYWKQNLANAPTVLELPTDRQRPPVQSFQGATQCFDIPLQVLQALNALSRQEGVTLFMTLLAAFQTLLYRYTGQQDILVGSPIAGRNRAEVENLIGFFVNILVLRTDMSGNPSFQQLLQRVREMAISAYANQDVPFEKLVQELQPERSLAYNPLFQVMFVLQNKAKQTIELPGLSIAAVDIHNSTSQFDLTLTVEPTEQGLRTIWEYSTDLFNAATIGRMFGHFQTLLEQIVDNPQQKVVELSLLKAEDRHQLLAEWNNTHVEYALDKCIHQLFEAQVERTPNKVAVAFENQQLTYEELNHRANQLAHHLRSLGVEPEVLVGLFVERSIEMIVGLLAILKAGGAYVPLDPSYPTQRLAYQSEDSGIKVLLTQQKLLTKLPDNSVTTICLDTDRDKFSQASTNNPVTLVKLENLAYVIYTSGSTGQPKGVMVPHSCVVNFTQTSVDTYGINQSDRVLQFSSFGFDIAVEEIYPCLTVGGTLVLRTDAMLGSVQTFVQKCQEWEITVLDLPTAYWHQLTTSLATTNEVFPPSLRLVIIGGEKVLPEYVRIWQNLVGERPALINSYGPTETTVVATIYPISAKTSLVDGQQIPIGRPIGNVQVFVLDANEQPVPIGVPGELYIGGAGVARGYLNRPELTRETFIPNPLTQEETSRLYKTGDLVRYLPNGELEYIGRIDNQVKLRGFRIELGEIETVVSQHPSVLQTVVIAREDIPGDKRLVAYVVVKSEHLPTSNELRSFVKEQLPDYMLPSAFVFLDTLPLTPNGKVNRRALPVPDASYFHSNNFVAPRTPSEETLAGIWSQVLGLERISIHDNFFELGGHSLLATQMVSRIREALGVNIQLQLLFQTPTIDSLAEVIVQIQAENTEDDEMNLLLAELENLSDEEAQSLLAKMM